ncbi:MAG: glycoside hydrolase family 20 zincin-like fold domain-containing protein [Planctomycetota bacterium]|nr:glycoside hydrolase family 20 zincin-like fold domain-containing protein [Planctomycetota bacterium]
MFDSLGHPWRLAAKSSLFVRCFAITVVAFSAVCAEEDVYEERIADDFVEHTSFRFRTKFNRVYIETPLNEFKTLISRKIDVPPLLDGALEDPCWRVADHTKSAFSQRMQKTAARKQTVAYVCHDDKNLYMAIVNEDPSLKGVQMRSHFPAGRRSWQTAGHGDCIEHFIELGGVGGTGQVFQFIYNIYPEVCYDGLFPPPVAFIGTRYRLAGGFGAKRWLVELAFPYKGFNTDNTDKVDYRYEGPPRRGEVWGMRIMRFGPKFGREADRMGTSWTFNPTPTTNHIPFPTGTIVFEDRNALHNGKMNEVRPGTNRPEHWKVSRTGGLTEGGLVFDEKAGFAKLTAKGDKAGEGIQITQKFGVLPNVGYQMSVRLKKIEGDGKITIGVDRPFIQREINGTGEWETHQLDFFAEPHQREGTMFFRAIGGPVTAAIDEVSIEQQIYGAPTGATCLTGNCPRPDLNIDTESLQGVKYTYRNPGTDQERFPFKKRWSHGWVNGLPDAGGTTGWIPATEGSLTNLELQQTKVEWSHPRPSGGSRSLYKSHDIIFDLGREFYIRSVELLPLAIINNLTVSIKAEGSDHFILARKLRGAGVVNPPGAVLYGRLRGINSVGRFVKIEFDPMGKYGHGLYFVRVWGEEKGDRAGIQRFRWKGGLVVPEEKYQQFRKLKGPVLMPTPQEVEWGEGEFIVKDGTPVLYRNDGRGEAIARELESEVRRMFGIRLGLSIEKGEEASDAGRGAIVLGDAAVTSDGLAARLARERGWKISGNRPGAQGYFLSARPNGILICGYDQAGTFYGVQTLLQLLVRKDYETVSARSVEVRDWPYIPWRLMDIRGPGYATPALIRALARLKVNVIRGSRGPSDIVRMRDDRFMFAPGVWASHSGGSPIEMDDDENWYHVGSGPAGHFRINACPSHFQRYEFYERSARNGAHVVGAQEVNINTDEMDGGGAGSGGGSRWLADRRCLDRRMTGDELFTEMVVRAYDLSRVQNIKMAMLDTMLVGNFEGGNGEYYDMYKAYDRIPEDIHIYSWRGFLDHESSNPEEAVRRFDRVTYLQSSFPFQNRGRINEAYKAPPGKRTWGVWNTVWGAAGPADQVLTGQLCRGMRSVDGGAIIPFMCQAWNPDSPPVQSLEWALKVGHAQQRLGELALERELPSWRDGVRKEFFKIDLRDACNGSHIDPVPGDGKDWLDWGPNNDLRRLPTGEVTFEEVPFHVIDPKTNGGESIVVTARQASNPRLSFPGRSQEISILRKAASLVFLRTNLGTGHLPGYRITYEGGKFLTVPLDAMGNGSKHYSCYGLYPPGESSRAPDDPHANFKKARHQLTELYSLFFRPAWLGTTGCGDPVKVTMHEWVNPYPELAIESVSIRYPPGRQSSRKEVLFAITGIAPEERDLALWRDRGRLPLVPPNEVEIGPGDSPVIPPDGRWVEEEDPKVFLGAAGNEVCQVTGFYRREKGINNRNFFKRLDNSCLGNGGIVKLASPQVCKKVALRGLFYWESHSVKPHYGLTRFRRTDYVVEVSLDGKNWTKVGEKRGICGEDGAHVHALPQTPIQYIRVRLKASHYITTRTWSYSAGPGLTWMQLYN